jgi:hypothetical protein
MLLLLIMQSGGLFMVLKMQQYAAKAVMQSSISCEANISRHLRIYGDDYIKSIVDNKEIFYQGKLYDVISMAKGADSVDLTVIQDEKEGSIFKRIKYLFTSSEDSNKKTPQELIRLLSLDYLQTSHPYISIVFYPYITYKTPFVEGVIIRSTEVFLPPPELV